MSKHDIYANIFAYSHLHFCLYCAHIMTAPLHTLNRRNVTDQNVYSGESTHLIIQVINDSQLNFKQEQELDFSEEWKIQCLEKRHYIFIKV